MNISTMTQTNFDDYKRRINAVNDRLVSSLRRTVSDAIELGGILCEVKEKIGHGGFLPWLEKHCGVSERMCYRYMDMYSYNDKIAKMANLQEAYAQIETLKAQEKREAQEKRDKMMREYKRTGVKPDGWDRSCDYEYKKWHDETSRTEKINEAVKKKSEEVYEKEKQEKDAEENYKYARKILDERIEYEKNKIKNGITQGAKDIDDMLESIDFYLSRLPDHNRRIEACNNIISHCKSIAVKLHSESVK